MTKSKRFIIILLSIGFLLFPIFNLAAADEGHGRAIDQIIAEIEQNQGATDISEINPDKVSPGTLEELGDAVMGIMVADDQRHEWMDQMMGGEGSEQLASVHRLMGYRYLQSNGDLTSGIWGNGMMRYGMGPGMMGSWGLNSGWYGPNSTVRWMNSWMYVIWLILLIIVVILVIAFVRVKKTHKFTDGGGSASDIISTRYARGEISREEYLQLRKDIGGK